MQIPTDFFSYAKLSAIVTIVCLVVTIIAFIAQWGIRFRFVGVTSFMTVLTTGLLALNFALVPRTEIPGAVRYSLVYDNAANRAVIAVPSSISKSALEATLQQAAINLYSPGRLGAGNGNLTILARTILHPQPGLSQPLKLGKIERSLEKREDEAMIMEIYSENLALLPEEATE